MEQFEAIVEKTKELRKKLHGIPEPSMEEYRTKQLLLSYLREHTNLEVIDKENWFYAVKKGKNHTAPVAFRADYDAVCIDDKKAGHYCGHDGHAACLFGLAMMLSHRETEQDIYLIFQPGEETGQGAILCRSLLREKKIRAIFGYHNIPGFSKGAILLREGTFALASTGLEITMKGTPSHAAYPEQGKNPAIPMAKLICYADEYIKKPHRGILLATVIGVQLGSEAYGVSASEGTLRFTIRGEYKQEYDEFLNAIDNKLREISREEGIEISSVKKEPFEVTSNTKSQVEKIKNAAESLHLPYEYLKAPFRWSEDFGAYLEECEGAFFGVGIGENHPGLHTAMYEFEDDIIPAVLKIFNEIAK